MKQAPTKVRPSPADLAAAKGKTIPDVIARGLTLLFCGINPSLYSAWMGHHFARPGNRFWPALHAAGITGRLFRPEEDAQLLKIGCGVTNIVARATAAADELSREELILGGRDLEKKVLRYQPRALAVLGVSAYRAAFDLPKTTLGLQDRSIGETRIWVLPNPSGLNAHFTPARLAELFRELWEWADAD